MYAVVPTWLPIAPPFTLCHSESSNSTALQSSLTSFSLLNSRHSPKPTWNGSSEEKEVATPAPTGIWPISNSIAPRSTVSHQPAGFAQPSCRASFSSAVYSACGRHQSA